MKQLVLFTFLLLPLSLTAQERVQKKIPVKGTPSAGATATSLPPGKKSQNDEDHVPQSGPESVAASFSGKTLKIIDIDKEIEAKPVYGYLLSTHPDKKDEIRAQVLNAMINRTLFLEEAKKSSAIDEQKVRAAIDDMVKKAGGKEKLAPLIEGIRMTYDSYMSQLADDIRLQQYIDTVVTSGITASEEELRKAYEENPQEFTVNEQARVRQIFLAAPEESTEKMIEEAKTKITALYAQLTKPGAKFEDIAKKNSEDKFSAPRGGDLGFVERGKSPGVLKELEETIFSLKSGEVSRPLQTSQGFHILKLEERKDAPPPTFEHAHALVEKRVKELKKQKAIQKRIDELRRAAKVKIFLSS